MAEHVDTIRRLKHEALACFLASDPTNIPVPTARAIIPAPKGKGAPTLNKAFVAACVVGAAAPQDMFTIGPGWAGDKHGQYIASPGEGGTGRWLGEQAILAERTKGRHGAGREDGGYGDEYRTGYLLHLRHGHCKATAAFLLQLSLLIDYLLTVPGTGDVIEIGGRATGGKSWHGSISQAIWKGEAVKVPEHDWATSCQMLAALTPAERDLIGPAPQSIEEAVAMLEAIPSIVLPARLEWWGGNEKWWKGQVNWQRHRFVQKRTGEKALCALAYWRDEPRAVGRTDDQRLINPLSYAWHLTLTEDGLTVHRRPEGSEPPPPEPDPEDGKPELHYLDEGDELALALVRWGDEHGFQPAREWGREIRLAIRAARKRLREESGP